MFIVHAIIRSEPVNNIDRSVVALDTMIDADDAYVSDFDLRNGQRRAMRGLVRSGAMRGLAKDGEERIQRGMVQLVASWAGIAAKNSKN